MQTRDARPCAKAAISALLLVGVFTGHALGAPAAAPSLEDTQATWRYRVVRGDKLYAIARTYLAPGIGWQRLQRFNRVANPKRLDPGRELRLPMAWLRAEATVATVAFVTGRAQRAGSEAALVSGDTLRPGDVLTTDEDANITLRLVDDTRVLVSGGSRMRMESLLVLGRSGAASSKLGLEKGEADSRVNPEHRPGSHYDVRTPVLTLGVRGTEFRVRVEDAEHTAAEVTQGRVAATGSKAGERSIDAGFGVVAAASAALPAVEALPAEPNLTTLPVLYERVPLRFSWPPLQGAAAYRAQVFSDTTLNERLLDGSFTEPEAHWADLPDGRYLLQVRARNAQGLEGRDGQLAFTLKARPEPPFTTVPRDEGRVYGERVEFSWTSSVAAERYRFQLASDSRFEALVQERQDLSSPQLALSLLPGRYHWRVATIAAGADQGPFSDSSSFDLRATPPPPAPDAPKAQGDKMVFRWRARSSDDAYDVQVAHDAAFTQLVLARREGLPELLIDKPAPGVYYLRVRTIENDGFEGSWGAPQQFEVRRSLWWWAVPGALLLFLL